MPLVILRREAVLRLAGFRPEVVFFRPAAVFVFLLRGSGLQPYFLRIVELRFEAVVFFLAAGFFFVVLRFAAGFRLAGALRFAAGFRLVVALRFAGFFAVRLRVAAAFFAAALRLRFSAAALRFRVAAAFFAAAERWAFVSVFLAVVVFFFVVAFFFLVAAFFFFFLVVVFFFFAQYSFSAAGIFPFFAVVFLFAGFFLAAGFFFVVTLRFAGFFLAAGLRFVVVFFVVLRFAAGFFAVFFFVVFFGAARSTRVVRDTASNVTSFFGSFNFFSLPITPSTSPLVKVLSEPTISTPFNLPPLLTLNVLTWLVPAHRKASMVHFFLATSAAGVLRYSAVIF